MVARYLVAGPGLRKPTVDVNPKRWDVVVVAFEPGLPLARLWLRRSTPIEGRRAPPAVAFEIA
jgi:hypothetical protein